ncbi:MAG: serine/threonine-protein kinase [Planctomycetota bacterium]
MQATPDLDHDSQLLTSVAGCAEGNGYRITGRLDAGGQALVLAGQRQRDGLAVVIKTLRHVGEDSRRRFIAEARALATCQHRCIPKLLDIDLAPGDQPYLIMTRAPGVSLRRVLLNGAVPAESFELIALALAELLQHLAERGIVHRDIKPDNIMVGVDRTVSLIDFGLALVDRPPVASKPLAGPAAATTPIGTLLGTPPYLAPEQLRDPARVDPRADWHAFGVTLGECLRHVDLRLPPTRRRAWQQLIEGLQAADPDRRPAPMLIHQLAASPWPRRHWLFVGISAAVLAGLAAAIGLVHYSVDPRSTRMLHGSIDADGDELRLRLDQDGEIILRGLDQTRLRLPGGGAWSSGPLTIRGQPGEEVLVYLRDPDGHWQVELR